MMNVVIIGAGAVARRGHLPALKRFKDVNVAAIVDTDIKLAKDVAAEYRIDKYANKYAELLEDVSIDVVDICTPTDTHIAIIRNAIKYKKHIIVEKPMVGNLKDAVEVYHLVRQSGVKFNVIQNWRYFPAVNEAKKRIDGGYIGAIASIDAQALTRFPSSWTRNTWMYHSGGALFDFAPHLIDMLLWLKKIDVIKVHAMGGDFTGGNMGFINNVQLILEFADHTIASVTVSWVTAVFAFTLNFHGTGGEVCLDVRGNFQYEVHGYSTPLDETRKYLARMFRSASDILTGSFFSGAMAYYQLIFKDFFSCIKLNSEEPVSARHGLMVTAVLDAAKRSIESRKTINLCDEIADLFTLP